MNSLQANPGIMAMLALGIAQALVLTVIGFVMRASGASLRPIAFMATLMLSLTLLLFIGQLVRARAAVVPFALNNGQFTDIAKLFGKGVPFVLDANKMLPGFFDGAEIAGAGISSTGQTVFIAQFASNDEVTQAGAAFNRSFQLHDTTGDEEHGWSSKRSQGDYSEMLKVGRQLFIWTGPTRESAAAARAASNLDGIYPRPPLLPALQPITDFFAPPLMRVLGVLLAIFLYTLIFFKGLTWCSSTPPVAHAPTIPASDLTTRLMAINDLDVPFTITPGEKPNELTADWRYADAKWFDLAHVHGMRKTFRIRLTLDESTCTVRATDYQAEFDWSVGRSRASLQWKALIGIVLFQKEQTRVFGFQFDEQGRLKPELSYSYKFDLNEMKSPIQATVTRSGWTWRPAAWQGPTWLRWLTE